MSKYITLLVTGHSVFQIEPPESSQHIEKDRMKGYGSLSSILNHFAALSYVLESNVVPFAEKSYILIMRLSAHR
jgi:hypothetical protein